MAAEGETFCERLVNTALSCGDRVAMTVIGPGGKETVTFGSMLAQIRSVAYRLIGEKIEFGDRVALIGENDPNWAVAYLGTLYRGAVITPLDPSATTQALGEFLKGSEAKLAFVSPLSMPKFRAACEQIGRSIPVVALHGVAEANGAGHFEEWLETPTPREFIEAKPPAKGDDLAVLIYTSGTTGTPKAVPLTHGNIYAEITKVQEVMHVSDQEVVLSLLPLFHAYSQIVNLWLATMIGAQVVYLSELSSAGIEKGLREGEATALVGVPRLWYLFHKKIFDAVQNRSAPARVLFHILLWMNGVLRDWLRLNAGRLFFKPVHRSFGGKLRLAVSAGASFDEDVARDFHRLGFTILQGYGLTETTGAATVTRFEDNKIGSVGTPLNGVEVKIDQPDAAGIGEVLIRGPVVMSGYYRNPEANKEAFNAEGFFRSGDLGRFDKQGHLFIVGRKKDVIKLPSGKNVFPEDVEAHYEKSPFVSEVCVLGVKDESSKFKRAEKLCAVVVPNFEHLKTRQIGSARDWVVWELENLGRELPEYQRVHDFVLRAESLPRTSTRKLRRFELQNQLEALRKEQGNGRVAKPDVLVETDQALMESPAGRATIAAVRQHTPEIASIQPAMNFEIDLSLDSLARAECFTTVEQMLGIELTPEELATVQTVGELVQIANAKVTGRQLTTAAHAFRWHDALAETREGLPEVEQLLKPKPVLVLLAYVSLRLIYFAARLLFRMDVKGQHVLTQLQPPYLVCPNHQSYLDPFLVCSTYSRQILRNTFHVGASMYFTNSLMAQLARIINVVPIDPDVQLLRAMRAGAAGLHAKKILNIYPEGQRSLGGELQEFKRGAAILATELKVPIVPVALDGPYRIWPRKSWRFRLAKVNITFGEPIDPSLVAASETDEDVVYAKLTAILRQRIQQMLDNTRPKSS
ncbi:MAG TPA: AMP-binding protein [Pyrinomonadaceae bacterium]|nr:AMP-binding protein [Pyrinomonadaceae bacterium]